MVEREAELVTAVEPYLKDVEAADAADDADQGPKQRGGTAPPAGAQAQQRLATIRAAATPAARAAAAEAAGQPVPPAPDKLPVPDPPAQSHFTDPESRIMRHHDQAVIQGYNAPIAVDAEPQIILAADVTNPAADNPPLLAVVDQVIANTGKRPVGVLADAGYGSENHRPGRPERHIEGIIPPEKLRHRAWRTVQAPRGRIPQPLSPKDRRRRYLHPKAGRRRYRRRQVSVGPVIGYLKTTPRCRQFLTRGLEAVRADWRLHCAVANLAKILRTGRWQRPTGGWKARWV